MAATPTWSGVLEALHSALIDALNAALPDTALLLGLPQKTKNATPPDPNCTQVVTRDLEVAGLGSGLAILAASAELASDHRLTLSALWPQLVREAEKGAFAHKGLQPILREPGTHVPTQVIWIPVGAGRARVLLGLGI
jgi:hypothetical protein